MWDSVACHECKYNFNLAAANQTWRVSCHVIHLRLIKNQPAAQLLHKCNDAKAEVSARFIHASYAAEQLSPLLLDMQAVCVAQPGGLLGLTLLPASNPQGCDSSKHRALCEPSCIYCYAAGKAEVSASFVHAC